MLPFSPVNTVCGGPRATQWTSRPRLCYVKEKIHLSQSILQPCTFNFPFLVLPIKTLQWHNLVPFVFIYTWQLRKCNEWFSSNRILMLCAQDFGIARGQTLPVATKNCMAWSCFSVKSSVFGHRMPHFAVILWETEVTNVSPLKFQVSVWLMR